jgi:biotin synthase
VCTTHRYVDRLATVRAAKVAGREACGGGIMEIGGSPADQRTIADAAFGAAELIPAA